MICDFIEVCPRGDRRRCRIQVDRIQAISEETKVQRKTGRPTGRPPGRPKAGMALTPEAVTEIAYVRLHLGYGVTVDIYSETLDEVWNKISQALGRRINVFSEVTPGYPGHPDYRGDKKTLAEMSSRVA